MAIQTLTQFLMWCVIINAGLLTFSFLACVIAGGWVYKMHTKWFPMPRETFNVVLYSVFGLYKVLFILFNVVPYVALLIIA